MKSSVSLAIAVAALTIGVPTAAADMGTSGSLDWFERAAAAEVREAGATPYVDAFERPDSASASVAPSAATTRDSGATPYVDAFERPDTAAGASVATSPDWFERSAAAAVRNAGATPYVDAF
jgi:hypothetical protein